MAHKAIVGAMTGAYAIVDGLCEARFTAYFVKDDWYEARDLTVHFQWPSALETGIRDEIVQAVLTLGDNDSGLVSEGFDVLTANDVLSSTLFKGLL